MEQPGNQSKWTHACVWGEAEEGSQPEGSGGRAGPGSQAGARGPNMDTVCTRQFFAFSRGLAIGVSTFLWITNGQNTGTHADLSQAFLRSGP